MVDTSAGFLSTAIATASSALRDATTPSGNTSATEKSDFGEWVANLVDTLGTAFGPFGVVVFLILSSLPVLCCALACVLIAWFALVPEDRQAAVIAALTRMRPGSHDSLASFPNVELEDYEVVATPQYTSGSRQLRNDLVVMTLNLQYFSSYPKNPRDGQYRLSQVLNNTDSKPDIICVQEGLHSRNVLEVLGYQLILCSAKEGKAQSVYDMVYGDEPALKACDPETHQHYLCNQLYMRKDSEWQVLDQGVIQISSDAELTGGGGRLTGTLAIRTMVWAQLRKRQGTPCVYVMCTHITGGRFEDQYFVQQMADERKDQCNKIISFFNERRASADDVGIVVGDFNATSVYTSTGAMHDYYKAMIATSPGVQADSAAAGVEGPVELEGLFADYMISPFTAISAHGWTFAYDRQQVGYTSGFGHCIDHMAMSRPLQVHSTEVIHLTNQKFGNKPKDAPIVLTDHNSVKCVFKITPKDTTHTYVFRTEFDFLQHLRQFKALVHISGFGSKQQFMDVDDAVEKVAEILFECEHSMDNLYGKGCWAACFGGDPANASKPDVGMLVQKLQQQYKLHIIAVQCDYVEKEWGGVDKHVDAVYYYPTDYQKDGKTIAWGGEIMGKTIGTTRILLEVSPLSGLPMYWIACGGGDITAGELRAAYNRGLAILSTPQYARYAQDPAMPYGPCPLFWDSLPEDDYVVADVAPFRIKKGTNGTFANAEQVYQRNL